MQSLPLEVKIKMSQRRIRDWYEYWNGEVYISFSGGKDSTVLKHLVETTPGVVNVPSVFVNTGLEYPEVRKFAVSQPNVTVITPKMRFDQVIAKYGYPVATKEQAAFVQECRTTNSEKLRNIRLNGNKWGRGKISKRWLPLVDAPFKVSDKCCDIMKKNPVKEYEKETGRKPYIGTMANESKQRESNWIMYGCNAFEKKRPTSQPLSFWTEQDILEYLVKFNIPYSPVYGDIKQDENGKYYTTVADRTGCMFCMFGCHLEKEPNRFQRIKVTHPKQWDYCMNKLGLREVLEYIGVAYE
jgi:3'-phosphoadenosine 5'-phosphosulfate sulfotransferase (PAPS reductase)/FAD synthetase